MKDLNTKEGRQESRDYQFNKLIEQGYTRENYKTLDFFTKEDGKFFTLKAFRGTSAKPVKYMNYRSEESRAAAIQSLKDSHQRNLDWKAEHKAKGQTSNHAGASAAVKQELIAAFPGIKFSVTSSSYSMGDSVSISWADGPAVSEVEKISGKYQYGSFDGQQDLYETTNRRDDIPQSKYVKESRSMSAEVEALIPDFEALFTAEQQADYHNNPKQIFRRIFNRISLPANYSNLRIEKTDCTGGQWEDFYTFAFDMPESKQQAAVPQFNKVEVTAGEINIVDYSEKAFAVVGDTKPIKDQLKALGGKFNFRLTCGAGWIFPKTKLAEVTKALSGEGNEPTPEPEQPNEPQEEETEEEQTDWRRHPEFPFNHPLNICDPESSQYKSCVKEYLPELISIN